jgi:gamma-glutamylcyclotransferase
MLSQMMESGQLYFAFGSNLWLSQMAARCPESKYIGCGRLPGYRWQINQCGYANVVLSADDHVDGLVYLLSASDEAILDSIENVPSRYEKLNLDVQLSKAAPVLAGRKTVEIVEVGPQRILSLPTVREDVPASITKEPEVEREPVSALVYVSDRHVSDDWPKREYVDRINNGVVDALRLGIDPKYVEDTSGRSFRQGRTKNYRYRL